MKQTHTRLLNLLRTGVCPTDASNETISEHLNCSPRTVSRQLVDLVHAGIIVIQRRPPNANGPGTDPTGRTIILTSAADYYLNSTPPDKSDQAEK